MILLGWKSVASNGDYISRPAQRHARPCVCHLFVRKHQLTVDNYIADPHGILVWLIKSGAVANCFFVEDYKVGSKAFSHQAAISKAEGLGWQRSHFADRIFQR